MKERALCRFSITIVIIFFKLLTPGLSELEAQEGYPPIDTTNLVAYYDFYGSYRDSMGNNAEAVPYLTAITEDRFCQPQRALAITEKVSNVQIADDSSLDFTDNLSISFWLYLDTIPETETRIISKSDPAGSDSGSYWISVHPGPKILDDVTGYPWSFSFTDREGEVRICKTGWGMVTQEWMLYTVTFDGTDVIFYVGAEAVAQYGFGATSIRPDDHSLWIGNTTGSGLTGKMDDIMFYDRIIQDGEIDNLMSTYLASFKSDSGTSFFNPEIGDTLELVSMAHGSFVQYQFMKGEEVIQEGSDSICRVVIETESDYGEYTCRAYNCNSESIKHFELNSCSLYDDIYIYNVPNTQMYAAEGDKVDIHFYVNSNLEGLQYEMYHNGFLIPDVFNGTYTIEEATMADTGAYYLVVINGCERLVSDTVNLIIESQDYLYTEVEGWDWTGNIRSAGRSYFSSICMGPDSSICLLGHFSGGLKVEDTVVFSSVEEDIFIVKYAKNGVYQWSKYLVSPSLKGKGDLAMDTEGNVYVSGSYWDQLQIEDSTLTTNMVAGSAYILKYNPSGTLLWIRPLETTRGVRCDNIQIDSANNIYMGGNFSGSLKIDSIEVSGTWDPYANVMFVAKLDTAGSCRWVSHAVTDPFMDAFGLIDMDMSNSGDLVVSGTMTAETNFGNGVVLSAAIEAPFLVKYDSNGVANWGTTLANEFAFAESFDVSVDDLGRIFLTGMHLGEISFGDLSAGSNGLVMEEIFLARFDSAGVCRALNSYGSLGEGSDFGVCYEPATDSTGYLMGMFGDTLIMKRDTLIASAVSGGGPVSPNMFIAKLNVEGEALALQSAGVIGNQHYGEILIREDGRLYFAGLNVGVAVKKATSTELNSVAFVGYKENGIEERTEPVEIRLGYQETICLGDSMLFRGLWCIEAGIYTDRVHGTDGIDSVFTLELVTEICTSAEDGLGKDDIVIYPNPVSQMLYASSPDQVAFDLRMYGVSGNLIWQGRDRSEYRIDVQSLQSGLYFLRLIKSGESTVFKVLVE